MKLHLGNGTVYLSGWTNVDVAGVLSSEHPELVERNSTTIDKYYKYAFRHNMGNNVTDVLADVRDLPFADDVAEEILCVNLIDHMKKDEFLKALQGWKRVLKPGGTLIIDVDDRQKQAQLLAMAETRAELEWGLRLMYCDHKAPGRTHWWGYTPEYLKDILTEAGFTHVWTRNDYIIHDITANFQICVQK